MLGRGGDDKGEFTHSNPNPSTRVLCLVCGQLDGPMSLDLAKAKKMFHDAADQVGWLNGLLVG